MAYCGVGSDDVSSNKIRGENPSELSSARRGESDDGGVRGGRYNNSAIVFYSNQFPICPRPLWFAHLYLYTHPLVSLFPKMLQLLCNA